jgi:hypothetical protein
MWRPSNAHYDCFIYINKRSPYMNSGRDSKLSPSSDKSMHEIFTEGQSFSLPDDKGREHVEKIRAALSSYYETRRPPKQTSTSNEKSITPMAAVTGAMISKTESPLIQLPGKKSKAIKPIRKLSSHLDSELLQNTSTPLQKQATQANGKNTKIFQLANDLFGSISSYLEPCDVNVANRMCRETNRLFQNQMRDELKEKQPLLQKLLQYVVDADKDHAEEFIKWHYRFQLVTAEEKIPTPPEKDVIYVAKTGDNLKYSLMTSDGKCSVEDRTITLAELNGKDKKVDQKIEIPANLTKENLKALRPLILGITHGNNYTQPKNNRCLLTMKGMIGCDLFLMSDEKNMQNSDTNCLRLYRKNSGLVYCINGKEHNFESLEFTVEITKLFDEKDLNKNGVLANNKLKWLQIEACKALLAEITKRGHISYVYSGHRIKGTALQVALGAEDVSRATHPDEGMAEMLMGELRKLPEGEIHIRKQIDAQFSEGWEAIEEKRHAKDLIELCKVRNAITASTNNNDPKLIAAIQEFKEYLEPKDIIETGKHWNAWLLHAAIQLGYNEYYNDARKDNFFYDQVIGSINTHAPTNYAMAQAQGLSYLLNPEKFNRSLKYRQGAGSYFPLSSVPRFRLGVDSWVDGDCGTVEALGYSTTGRLLSIRLGNLVTQKHQRCEAYATFPAHIRRPAVS